MSAGALVSGRAEDISRARETWPSARKYPLARALSDAQYEDVSGAREHVLRAL